MVGIVVGVGGPVLVLERDTGGGEEGRESEEREATGVPGFAQTAFYTCTNSVTRGAAVGNKCNEVCLYCM